MLKTTWLAPIGLASLLLAPAADDLGGIGLDELVRKLEETRRSLDVLEGIAQLPLGDTRIERVLAATEPAAGTPRERDRRLDALREEVSRLREAVDRIDLAGPAAVPPPSVETGGPSPAPAHEDGARSSSSAVSAATTGPLVPPALGGAPPTTGLSPEELRRLSAWMPPVTSTPTTAGTAGLARGGAPLEAPDYSADPLRQGRAYFRAGRYAEALVLLARAGDDLEAKYWRARCHEKLGHLEEALAGYEEVARLGEGTALGQRSRDDFEFLSWKQTFLRRFEPSGGRDAQPAGEAGPR